MQMINDPAWSYTPPEERRRSLPIATGVPIDRVHLTLEQRQHAGCESKAYANAEGWQHGHVKG